MTTELSKFGFTPIPRHGLQRIPFLVRRLAGRKPNRLSTSIRMPVTPANRAILRDLRAAELAAWQRAFQSRPAGEGATQGDEL